MGTQAPTTRTYAKKAKAAYAAVTRLNGKKRWCPRGDSNSHFRKENRF